MKKIILLISFLNVLNTAFCQKIINEIVRFKSETIDMGKIEQNHPTTATFEITNTGKSEIIIEQANPTCGCVISEYTEEPISPGSIGFIKATYNAKNINQFEKHLSVKFAGIDEIISLTIKGEVTNMNELNSTLTETNQVQSKNVDNALNNASQTAGITKIQSGTTTNEINDKTVALTVIGQGKTSDDATKNALRSAIEQAFGAFISSKTEILDDSLVKDEIVTVSNGSIKEFTILNQSNLPDGSFGVTLKAVVSINKLTSYCQSKGSVVEFSGGLFAINIAMQELNEKNEIISWYNTQTIIEKLLENCYDYSINAGEPTLYENELWQIPCSVNITLNKNYEETLNFIKSYLSSVSLGLIEVEDYKKKGKETFPLIFGGTKYYLRNKKIRKFIYNVPYIAISKSIETFQISNTIDTLSLFDISNRTNVKVECNLNPMLGLKSKSNNTDYRGMYHEYENGGRDNKIFLVNHPPSDKIPNSPNKFYLNMDDHAWDYGTGFATFDRNEKKVYVCTGGGFWSYNLGLNTKDELVYYFHGHEKLISINYSDFYTLEQIKKIKEYKILKNSNSYQVYFLDNEDPLNKPILSIKNGVKSSGKWESLVYKITPNDFKKSPQCEIVEIGANSGEKYIFKESEITFSENGFPQTITKKIKSSNFSELKTTIDKCTNGTVVTFSNIIVIDSYGNERFLDDTIFKLVENTNEQDIKK